MRMNYDAKGMDAGLTFPVAPEGIYTLLIKEVYDTAKDGKQKKTKNGDPMVSMRCEIQNVEHLGISLWHNVTFMSKDKPGAGMLIKFLKCIGEPSEDEFEVDTDNWVGKSFEAKVRIGKDLQGSARNEIAYVMEPQAEETPF